MFEAANPMERMRVRNDIIERRNRVEMESRTLVDTIAEKTQALVKLSGKIPEYETAVKLSSSTKLKEEYRLLLKKMIDDKTRLEEDIKTTNKRIVELRRESAELYEDIKRLAG